MARRSDFSQKLLDDLRMRKEQMGSSHGSNRSNQMPAEKYRYFKQTSKGLKEVNPSGAVSTRSRDLQKWSSSGTRRLTVEESSKAVVPVGNAQNSQQIGDLSRAFAFALKNGGELKKMESSGNYMASFLTKHFGRALDFGDKDRNFGFDGSRQSSGRFPNLSKLQIKEISRGAQKLNQILRACNNGANFDKYSIDIGKELLKGAMDLEESLRMLVSLQEASDYMVTPQRKGKVRLLEMEDDEEEVPIITNKQKQLDLPRFSFDRRSKNTPESVRGANKIGDVKQRLLALSYTTEDPQLSSEKQKPTSSNLASHRRAASCGPGYSSMTEISSSKKNSTASVPQPERGRLPNVIAKLMGLEELPANTDSKVGAEKSLGVNQGTRAEKDSTRSLYGSAKKFEKVTMGSEKSSPHTAIQRIVQASKSSTTTESSIVLYAGQTKATQVPTKTGLQEGKPHPTRKTTDDMTLVSPLTRTNTKSDTSQRNLARNTQIPVDKLESKRRQDNRTTREQKDSGKAEPREVTFMDDLRRVGPKIHGQHSKVVDVKQENAGTKEIAHQNERRNASNMLLVPSSQQKPLQDRLSQPPNKLWKPQSQFGKLQNTKNQLQFKNPKTSEKMVKSTVAPAHVTMNQQKKLPHINHVMPSKGIRKHKIDSIPSKRAPLGSHHEIHGRKESSANLKFNMKKKSTTENLESQRASPKGTEIGVRNIAAPAPPVAIALTTTFSKQELDVTPLLKAVHQRKTQEVMIKENGSLHNIDKALQDSISRETNSAKENRIRSSKEEANIDRSKSSEARVEQLPVMQDLQQNEESTSTGTIPEKEHQNLNELGTDSPNAIIQDMSTMFSDSQEASTAILDKDQALNSSNVVSVKIIGPHEENMIAITKSSEEKQQKIVKSEARQSLTENENHLKQILITSQLFLNAAEALFQLQIPVSILHNSTDKYYDQDSRIILDCSYEVMKRKGRRQEFTIHPRSKNTYVRSERIKCLDDLVKELQQEIETLKSINKHESDEHDAAETLEEMLKRDIENRNPDVNSMWDLGWNELMLSSIEKEDIMKDVEKHVLNGLLDEITRELLHVSTAAS